MFYECTFDFEKCVQTWNENWEKVCKLAASQTDNLPKFEDIVDDDIFSNVISQLLENKECFTTDSSDISALFRGIQESDSNKICVDRFIHKWEYVNKSCPNRMNGTDRLYSYFTIDYEGCTGEDLIYTSAHELRLRADDQFWGSYFSFAESKHTLKFVNIRSKCKIPKSNEECLNFLKSRATHGKKFGPVDKDELMKWVIQIVFSIWENSDMFAPIDNRSPNNLWLQYRPFHILCDYFERHGFDGIIYRSTVYKPGACLALFNICNAVCDPNSICKYDTPKYIGRRK